MNQHLPFTPPRAADPRMVTRRYQMLINGKSVDAESGETITRESPAYAGLIASEIPRASLADAERAILAARKAFDEGPWPRWPGAKRAKILHKIGDAILAHKEELATIEALEGGKAIAGVRGEMARLYRLALNNKLPCDELTRLIYTLKEIRACLEAEILTDVQQRLAFLSRDMDNHNGHGVLHQPTFPRS